MSGERTCFWRENYKHLSILFEALKRYQLVRRGLNSEKNPSDDLIDVLANT